MWEKKLDVINFRCGEEFKTKVELAAQDKGRSVGELIRHLLQQYLAEAAKSQDSSLCILESTERQTQPSSCLYV